MQVKTLLLCSSAVEHMTISKVSLFVGSFGPHLIHGPLVPHKSAETFVSTRTMIACMSSISGTTRRVRTTTSRQYASTSANLLIRSVACYLCTVFLYTERQTDRGKCDMCANRPHIYDGCYAALNYKTSKNK